MKNWEKTVLLVLSVVLLSIMFAYALYGDVHDILGIKTTDRIAWEELYRVRKHKPYSGKMCFEGKKLTMIEQYHGYLITQSMDTLQWQGNLSTEGSYEMCFLRPKESKTDIIHMGKALELMVYDEETYDILNIYVSGMPVLYLTKEPEVGYYAGTGNLLVLENQALGREHVIEGTDYICQYRNRGNTSALSPKRPWKLNLRDVHGRKRNEPLLGMKNDNDWIANPLYSDLSNMREQLGYEIWAMMDGENQHQSRYCEFVLEGDYQGIYLLSECVDYRTYNLSGQDSFLYSIKDWSSEEKKEDLYAPGAEERFYGNERELGGISIDAFPEGRLDQAIELLRTLYSEVSGETYCSEYSIEFDQKDMILHALLIDLLQANDNRYKNQKFALVKESENRYIVHKTPWDLDITMQNETYPQWAGGILQSVTDQFMPHDMDRAWLKAELAKRYWIFREKFYHMDNLEKRIDEYRVYLERTGAAQREEKRWNEQSLRESCATLKRFFQERIESLDTYYGE